MPANVLLVVLDSVRARNTSLHGHDHETTPFLSGFAAERATTYTQARAPAATSLTSHASMFTGLSVPEHGLTTTDARLERGHTVFEALQDEGYETGVFSENTWITRTNVGLNQGFDTVVGPQNIPYPVGVDPRSVVAEHGAGQYRTFLRKALASNSPIKSLLNGLSVKLQYDYPGLLPSFLEGSTSGEAYVDRFLDWHGDRTGPWAACLNLMDAHIPYDPGIEYDKWGGDRARAIRDSIDEQKWDFAGGHRPWWQRRALEGLYDGSIRQADSALERLVESLDDRGALEDTFLVITADHGEGFGERSLVRPEVRIAEHNVAIHEALLHVPLVVHYPGQAEGRHVEDLVSLTRFGDTVEALLDAGLAGSSSPPSELFVTDEPVLATAVSLDEAKRRRATEVVEDLGPYTATAHAVYKQEVDERIRKYVTWRDEARTVDIVDPWTSFVVEESGRARVKEAFEGVDDAGIRTDGTEVEEMDEETRRQLKDLGYA